VLGLGIVLLALGVYLSGGSIKGWAVTPGTWDSLSGLAADFAGHVGGYAVVFLLFGVVFTLSMAVMGRRVSEYVPGYVILFLGSLALMYLSSWTVAKRYDLGAPLLALVIGLIIGNLVKMPEWFKTALRTEYYIKTGIVLLGATLPLTLIFNAGPVAFLQATIVSVVTWLTIYLAATRLFKLEPQFGAVLGAGGAVCGVSASIAVGGAVKAKKDHIAISIGVVSVWAIVMILVLTVGLKFLVPDVVTPGEAGAWVGTSEFADAAGFAVVAEIANRHGDSAINTFTLMKVIGRDIWIGIWCLILSVVSVTLWERGEGGEVRHRLLRRVRDHEPGGGEWARGPRGPRHNQRDLQEQGGDDRVHRQLLRLLPSGRGGREIRARPRGGRHHLPGRDEPRGVRRPSRRHRSRRPEPRRQDRGSQAASVQGRLVPEHPHPETHLPDQEAPLLGVPSASPPGSPSWRHSGSGLSGPSPSAFWSTCPSDTSSPPWSSPTTGRGSSRRKEYQ
jgi:uncharacterized membrane protein YadS